jgi:peptidoglycan/xylan/chitin deacetylase (PgdA/CDA1 family)
VILPAVKRLAILSALVPLGLLTALAGGSGISRADRPAPVAPRFAVQFSPSHHTRHNAIVHVRTRRREVAFSFDDGPDPRWSPLFLRTLRRHSAHATFFPIGRQVLAYPDLVRQEVAEGHELGNHTFNHPRLQLLPTSQIRAEIQAGADAIQAVGGPVPELFRPPRGYFDERVGKAAADAQETMVDWDRPIDPMIRRNGAHQAARVVLKNVSPGAIILAHDRSIHPRESFHATRMILRGLERRHYDVVTISELLGKAESQRPPAWMISSPETLRGIEPSRSPLLQSP